MHTIQTHHLLCDLVGAETAAKLGKQRQTALLKSFGMGFFGVVFVSFAGCQQFVSKAKTVAVVQPVAVVFVSADDHDSHWISQAHAVVAESGSDVAVSDLSF